MTGLYFSESMSIEINHITKFYGKQKALDDVSFEVRQGEMLGFLGPNGAGKSTLMKIITGFLQADSGKILINGQLAGTENLDIRKEIGYLPENNPLYQDLYVPEYLDIVAGFYKIGRRKQRVSEMMALTGLEREKHKKIGALSKGYRQRIGLAQALIHDPSVLILDEPTSGLDPNQLTEIRTLIAETGKSKTVILSSHILQEIEAICQRVVIINQGRLVADNRLTELKKGMISNQQIFVVFNSAPDQKRMMALEGVGEIESISGGWLITSSGSVDLRPALFRFAVESGLILLEMTEKQQNLDSIFRDLTQ